MPPGNNASIIFEASGHPIQPYPFRLSYSCQVFFLDAGYRAPHPIEIIPPVRLFISWCTVNTVSTHLLTVLVPVDSRMSTIPLVPLRYFIIRDSLLLSSLSGSLTCVVRKSNLVRISGSAHLHKKNSFSTILWYACVSFWINFYMVLLTSTRWFATGVIAFT